MSYLNSQEVNPIKVILHVMKNENYNVFEKEDFFLELGKRKVKPLQFFIVYNENRSLLKNSLELEKQ